MKSNEVTQNSNTVLRINKEKFRAIGKRINRLGQDFCYRDFPMRKGAFRQRIRRLKDEIICTTGGIPCFYRFKDIPTGLEKGNVTREGMGVGKEFEKLLRDTKLQYPQIHDLKIKFPSTQSHYYLKSHGWKLDTTNQRLSITRMPLARWTWANISVYPKTVLIDIGCTSQPIVYDSQGAIQLAVFLERIRSFMIWDSKNLIEDIPEPTKWIVTQFHLNKDGFREYSGKTFNMTVEDVTGGIFRFYSKTFPDNRTRTRYEEIQTPKKTVSEVTNNMIATDIREN